MKTVKLVLVTMVGVMLFGASALVAEDAVGEQKRPRIQDRREFRDNLHERILKELDLTADQQAQVKQILETHKQAVENWQKENAEELKALREQMEKARAEKDTEAVKSLREKSAKIFKGRQELQESLNKQIKAVLTDEQKEKFENLSRLVRSAVIGAQQIRTALRGLDLNDEQKEKIKKIIAETGEAAGKVETPKGKLELWQKAVQTIKSDVLTEEQVKKFEQAMNQMRQGRGLMGPMADLNLTDDQKEQMEKIEAKYRDQIKNAGPEDRRELMKKMRDEMNSVLTDEQKAKVKKNREEQMNRRRQGRDNPKTDDTPTDKE